MYAPEGGGGGRVHLSICFESSLRIVYIVRRYASGQFVLLRLDLGGINRGFRWMGQLIVLGWA